MQLITQSHLSGKEMFLNEHVISHTDKSFWDRCALTMSVRDRAFMRQECESSVCTHGHPPARGQGPRRPGLGTDQDSHAPPCDSVCLVRDRGLTHCAPASLQPPHGQGQRCPPPLSHYPVVYLGASPTTEHPQPPAHRGPQGTPRSSPDWMLRCSPLRQLELVLESPCLPACLFLSALSATKGELEREACTG